MKMNLAPLKEPMADGGLNRPAPVDEPKRYRRLEFNELVSVGDFVKGKDDAFEPWDGPRGFQAGSFVEPIYRQESRRPGALKKAKNNN
jgi:hypothetical protein